jgi:hypothetical protein
MRHLKEISISTSGPVLLEELISNEPQTVRSVLAYFPVQAVNGILYVKYIPIVGVDLILGLVDFTVDPCQSVIMNFCDAIGIGGKFLVEFANPDSIDVFARIVTEKQ